jgi:vacuolar iron transporter family protein
VTRRQVATGRRSAAHAEGHRGQRAGWLRAGVLGADDGTVSTASLVIGVASAAPQSVVLIAGLDGLVAGAMSMATGEYVSVSSQRDAERADIARERDELAANPELELAELAAIYQRRGLDEELARTVAGRLMAVDPLAAHVRDEFGLSEELLARPVQAAVVSAASFAVGAVLPLLAVVLAPASVRILAVAGVALVVLGVLGGVGGRLGWGVAVAGGGAGAGRGWSGDGSDRGDRSAGWCGRPVDDPGLPPMAARLATAVGTGESTTVIPRWVVVGRTSNRFGAQAGAAAPSLDDAAAVR